MRWTFAGWIVCLVACGAGAAARDAGTDAETGSDGGGVADAGGSDGGARCYLGTSLPAELTVFADTSPWRVPIEASPAIDPNSDAMIARLRSRLLELGHPQPSLTIAYREYTAPIHVVDATACPRVDVTSSSQLTQELDPDQDRIARGLPIPAEAWPDPSDDAHLVVVDPVARRSWEMWGFARSGTGRLSAGMMGTWDLDGPGYNVPGSSPDWFRNGATAPRTPYIGGLIRPEEVAAGEIRHALNVITPINRLRESDAVAWEAEFCSPVASNTDGRNTGLEHIPEGARIQLDPALDVDALGLTGATRVIARALQVYGAYVMDSGGGFGIKAQNLGPTGGAWTALAADLDLSRIPLSSFRVLACTILTR